MADIMKDEVNGKVVITLPDKWLTGSYQTFTYRITDEGLVCINIRDSVGIEKARKRHDAVVAEQHPKEAQTCARCGEKNFLITWSRTFEEWLCPPCLTFKLEACR